MKGIWGKILHVDLSERKTWIEEPPEQFYRKYLGGGGLGSYYLLKHVTADIDPLSKENVLVFASGFLVGLPCSGTVRYSVVSKSPMNNAFGESEAGGYWAAELKFAGLDAIVVYGKASCPVYLWIKNGQCEIRDAAHLWGLHIGDAHEAIKKELNENRARIAQIGPAGEKQVRFACIINELKHTNGRCGMGAVMGSKNLKAIAVRGTQKPEWADPDTLKQIGKYVASQIPDNLMQSSVKALGTPTLVRPFNEMGVLPTKNYINGEFEQAENLSGETMAKTITVKSGTCYGCAVACKKAVKVERKEFTVDPKYGGPEYETIGGFGSLCLNGDLEVVAKAHELCQRYTMDTISASVTIAFAMECYEKGIITKEETGGIDLRFGNSEAILQILEQMGNREGFGDILAEGSVRAAEKIGKGSEKFTIHVKGLEPPPARPTRQIRYGIIFCTLSHRCRPS